MSHGKVLLVKAATGITVTALSAYFDRLLLPVVMLTAAMAVDYATGMARAFVTAALSSRTGIRGIVKKVCYLAAVAVGMGADFVLAVANGGQSGDAFPCPIACMVAVWLIVNELISILENLRGLGVPLPAFLVKVVKHLKSQSDRDNEDKVENEDDNNDNGKGGPA